MSLTSTSNRVVATGDGVTVLFNYNKLLYDATHLQVYVAGVLQSTGYTVNGVPGTSTSVTFSVAPANGAQIILLRVVPLTQLSVYAVGGAFPAATTEKNFDLLAMASQQFDDTTSRTLRQPLGDTVAIAELPATSARASQYMAFDANGDPTVMLGTSETPNVLLKTGGNLTGGINNKLTTVASAASPDIFALTVGNTIDYTGTATATGFAAAPQAGSQRTLVCAAASVFTAGANMLIDGLVSGQNYTAAAGDKVLVIAVTTTQFRLTPMKKSGQAIGTPIAQFGKAIYGLTYDNGTDAVNDFNINTGGAMDATGAYWMTLSTALGKQSDVAWAVGGTPGAPAGGLDTGAVGNNDYYIWLIARSDTGVVDALYSLSSTAPTMPLSGVYDFKRLIGWFKRVGGTVVAFHTYETCGGGLDFKWDSPTVDVSLSNTLTTARRLDAVKVPLTFSVTAYLRILMDDAAIHIEIVQCPDEVDLAPSSIAAPFYTHAGAAGEQTYASLWIRTNSSGQIAARSTVTTNAYSVLTVGFIWERRN